MSANRKPGPVGIGIGVNIYQAPQLKFTFNNDIYKTPNFNPTEGYDFLSNINSSRQLSFQPKQEGTKVNQQSSVKSEAAKEIQKFMIEEMIKTIADTATNGSRWILKFDVDLVTATAKIKQGKLTIRQLTTSISSFNNEADLLKKFVPGSANKVTDITRKISELERKIKLQKTTIIKNNKIVSSKVKFMKGAGKVLEAGGAALWGYQAITQTIELNDKIRKGEAEVIDYCEMALILLQAPLPVFGPIGGLIATAGTIMLDEQKKMLDASQKAIESMYSLFDQIFNLILKLKSGQTIISIIKSRMPTVNSHTSYSQHEMALKQVSESIRRLIASTIISLNTIRGQLADHDWMERNVLYSQNRDDWSNKVNTYTNTLIKLQRERNDRCTAFYVLYCSHFINKELAGYIVDVNTTNRDFSANQKKYKRFNELLEEKKLSLAK